MCSKLKEAKLRLQTAPFSYFGIPIAFLFGWAFFDETPWNTLFPGAALIILGGLLIVWRESALAKR